MHRYPPGLDRPLFHPMNSMGVRLFQVDTVVLGRFNPHIISPPWLAKEKIVEAESVQVSIAVVDRDVAFRFKTGDLTWQVDYSRLVISTDKISDTSALAAKVVQKLYHTPVSAMGNNFCFRCELSQWRGRLPQLGNVNIDALKGYGPVQVVGWRASISQEESLIVTADMTVEPADPASVIVNVNYHRPVNDAEAVVVAARSFQEDLDSSKKFLDTLFGQKVEQ